MSDEINDNEAAELREPDAHGQAALLLVESLIHGLVATSFLSFQEAMEIVDVTADANAEIGVGRGEPAAKMTKSMVLLQKISASLQREAPV